MRSRLYILQLLIVLTSCNKKNVDWKNYGGDSGGSRYSPLNQINIGNVTDLEPIWEYDTGEPVDSLKPLWNQCQPIVVDGILYGTTSRHKLFALDAASGEKKWIYDPYQDLQINPQYHPMRGVTYWEEGNDRRILYSVSTRLIAVNADTGKRIESFGPDGSVDLHTGQGDEKTLGYNPWGYNIRSTSPGVVFENLIIIGSSVSEGGDALPGYIKAYDIRTGELAWVFHTIPLPGQPGYETWAKDSYKRLGGANCWAGMVVDEKNGRVFLGTGSPSVDFYGGARPGQNLFANCLISLDARTGKRLWHFQTVHHDLWDKDIPCPPNLISVNHEGKQIEAVAQATKDGFVFIFDRETGKPLFPVKEVAVPTTPALPGEQPWPTQPIPDLPKPFANQMLTAEDITNRTPDSYAYVLDRYLNSDYGNKYLPPSEKGSLIYSIGGGAEWGGAAVDPSGIFYVNGNNMLWWLQMRKARDSSTQKGNISRGENLFNQHCTTCHSLEDNVSQNNAIPGLKNINKRLTSSQIHNLLKSGRGRMPSFQHISEFDRKAVVSFLLDGKNGVRNPENIHESADVETRQNGTFPYSPPYLNNGNVQFRDNEGYPAVKPPWGTLNAIDMNTGKYLWQIPFGEYPELMQKGLLTGTENHGGPLVTAGGLLFIGATYDEHLRAFESKTGKLIWKYKLPAGGFATPITYMKDGKQYLVICAGGGRYGLKAGSTFVAFALD